MQVSINCNFKIIAKTLATTHQLAQCSVWNVHDVFNTSYKQITSEEKVLVPSCRSRTLLLEAGYTENRSIKIPRTVTYYGIEYRKNLLVCVETSSEKNSNPVFGRIEELLLLNGQMIFHLQVWDTAFFHAYLNAFCKKYQGKSALMNIDELPYWHTYSIWVAYGEDKKYLSLKHRLI